MKKFDKVLLASDFDGTLKDDNGVITKDVLDAVRYFQENGGFFTLATGRTYQGFGFTTILFTTLPRCSRTVPWRMISNRPLPLFSTVSVKKVAR